MTKTVLLLACLAGLALSGCVGYPPDALRPGDHVRVTYSAFDLATGEPVVEGREAAFVLGSEFPLGYDVASALVGARVNATVTVESRDDPGRQWSVVRLPAEVSREAAVLNATVTQFRNIVGEEPVPGQRFEVDGAGGTVLAVEGDRVTLDLDPPPAEDNPRVGVRLEGFRDGSENVVRVVAALADPPRFGVAAARPGEYFDRAGTYQVWRVEGGDVVFNFTASQEADLVGRDLRFEVTVLSRQAARPGDAPVHFSPQLRRPFVQGDA